METTIISKQDLEQFTGSEHYYKHWLKQLVFTDGVNFLADKTGSYWLIDIIASYQPEFKGKYSFQLWELKVDLEDKTATVTMREDSNTPVIIKQDLTYTDFPLAYQKIYCVDNVVLLPSEY